MEHLSSLLTIKPDEFVTLMNNCMAGEITFEDLCVQVRHMRNVSNGLIRMFRGAQKIWLQRIPADEHPFAISYLELCQMPELELARKDWNEFTWKKLARMVK